MSICISHDTCLINAMTRERKKLCMATGVRGDFGLRWETETAFCLKVAYGLILTDSVKFTLLRLGMAQVSTGPAGGSDSAVLQDGAEVGGCAGASLSGRERLHGGKDEGQAVCYVFVRGTGQSWCVAFLIYSHDCCSSAQ